MTAGDPPIRLVTEAFPDRPGLDTAVARALLVRTARGEIPETFRLHRPGRVVAFGKHDAVMPGYGAAAAAAAERGFTAVLRLAGGRAALFHEETLAFGWTIPDPQPVERIHDRFRMLAAVMVGAFRELGVDARVGEIPGEYCPGRYSVNRDGSHKVMGVGQRLVRGAAHIGGVVVVRDAALVNAVLDPVYAALGIEWRPAATGALDEAVPGLTVAAVAAAIIAAVGALRPLEEEPLEAATRQLAERVLVDHLVAPAPH